jgi:hypothetical protein
VIGPTTATTSYTGSLRIYVIGTMGTATALFESANVPWLNNPDVGEPLDVHEYLANAKAERKLRYQRERERESTTAMHFDGHRSPRLEARQHSDPLRHHRLKGFRRASRRDQTEFRTEGTNR